MPDDDTLAQALRILVAEGTGLDVGHRRRIADAAGRPGVHNPVAFVRRALANAARDAKPEPVAQPPTPTVQVFVEHGSPAWTAWAATRTREFPTTQEQGSNRVGWYFASEFPPQEAAS